MNMQQAQQLAAEAEELVERLTAAWFDAAYALDADGVLRLQATRKIAVKRWGRRLEMWSMAAYGHGVIPQEAR